MVWLASNGKATILRSRCDRAPRPWSVYSAALDASTASSPVASGSEPRPSRPRVAVVSPKSLYRRMLMARSGDEAVLQLTG